MAEVIARIIHSLLYLLNGIVYCTIYIYLTIYLCALHTLLQILTNQYFSAFFGSFECSILQIWDLGTADSFQAQLK